MFLLVSSPLLTFALREITLNAVHLDLTAAIELEINYLRCLTVHTRRQLLLNRKLRAPARRPPLSSRRKYVTNFSIMETNPVSSLV